MNIIKLYDKGYVVKYEIDESVPDWLPEEINFTGWAFFQAGGGIVPGIFIGPDIGILPVSSRKLNSDDVYKLVKSIQRVAEYRKISLNIVDKTYQYDI